VNRINQPDDGNDLLETLNGGVLEGFKLLVETLKQEHPHLQSETLWVLSSHDLEGRLVWSDCP
jgi:hypothetical protein